MTNGSNRSKEIISRLGLSSRTFCFITNYGLRSVQTKTGIVQDYPDFAQGCSVSSSAFTLYMGDDTR